MTEAVDAFTTLLARRLAEALEPVLLQAWGQQPVRKEQLPPTMSVQETAEFLGIGRNAVYEAVHRDEIPSLRISSRIRIPTHALLKKLEEGDWNRKEGAKSDDRRQRPDDTAVPIPGRRRGD